MNQLMSDYALEVIHLKKAFGGLSVNTRRIARDTARANAA